MNNLVKSLFYLNIRIDDVASSNDELNESGINLNDIDAVATTAGPGLIVCLSVGLNFGKAIATSLKKPFIAGDIIWPNRNGIKRYDNENSEKFTFTKLDSSIEKYQNLLYPQLSVNLKITI